MAVYKNGELPMEMRLDAAKSAVRYEKPALASTDTTFKDTTQYHVALPDGSVSMEEWQAKYSTPKPEKTH